MVAGQMRSVYGASASLAAVFYQALGQKVACRPVYKPTVLDADDQAEVAHNFSDAAQRLQAAAPISQVQRTEAAH
jgi:hypothetical protein